MKKLTPLQNLVVILVALGWANAQDATDIEVPEIVAPKTPSDPSLFSLPCDEIASVCFKPDARICDLKCNQRESKEACRARRGCDNILSMDQTKELRKENRLTVDEFKECRRDCKLSSPETCKDDCMSQELNECDRSECENIVTEANRLSPEGVSCKDTFRLCLEMSRQLCVNQCKAEDFPTPDEWVPCEEVCETNGEDICRPRKVACEEEEESLNKVKEEIIDVVVPDIVARETPSGPPLSSLPCDEIASICFKPDARICDLKCSQRESKDACRARRGCDNLLTKDQIKECRRDCKLSSPETCKGDCMSQELDECDRSECEEIATGINRVSPLGVSCEGKFRLCLKTYRTLCVNQCKAEDFPTPDEWVPCEEVCETNGEDICRPRMEACKEEEEEEEEALNRADGPGVVTTVSPCEERSPPAPQNCFCDYEVSRIGYTTATRLTFEAWCVAGTGVEEQCGLYKCPECAPFDRSSCFSVGSSGGHAGLYEQACPPSSCATGSDQPVEEALWCQNGPDSTPCGPYFGVNCIPRHVYHPAQCEYQDGSSAVQSYECPAPRQGCEECEHPDHVECYVGSTSCSYCSFDCVPTGDFPVDGFGEFVQGRCDELIPIL